MPSLPGDVITLSSLSLLIPKPLLIKRKQTIRPNNSLSVMSATSSPNHIIIVGGGVMGASTAFFLSQKLAPEASTKITVIEKSSIAAAASGKSGGFLALDWCDSSSLSSLARASFKLHHELSQTLDGERNYGYRPLTTLSLSLTGSKNSSSTSRLRSSLPDWIDESSVGNLKTIGTTETTAQVHPKLFTQTLIDSCIKTNKVDIIIGEVKEVTTDGGKITGVVLKEKGQENNKVLKCNIVVFTVGPWSSTIQILSKIFTITGTKAHSIVLRPKKPDSITPHALFLSYQDTPTGKMLDPEVYPRPTGEVYICGMSQELQVPENQDEITGDPTSIDMLHKIAGKVSSHLRKDEEAEVVAEQACFLPCSVDGLPVIGELPGVEGCYVGTGHSCWGILNAPATGASLAELILDGRSSIVDLSPFSPWRFLKGRGRK